MTFERLPLALALSVTILGGGFLKGGLLAKPLLEGQAAVSGYEAEGNASLLIAARSTGEVSADSPAKTKTGEAAAVARAAKKGRLAAKADKDDKDKAVKGDKNDKDAKNDKDDKNQKAQKADKADNSDKAAKAVKEAADDGDKKKKGGFFHRKNNVEEEKAQAETKPEVSQPKKAEDEKGKTEAKAPPAFVPDDALISVLKDVNKALADGQNEQVAKVSNENERAILDLAKDILAKALTEPNLPSNRIVPKESEGRIKSALTAESWSSGDVVVNDTLRGSMAAVWAKRIGGLLTVTIAGDAGQRKTPDGNSIGEFMVVITAHSPVQSGFDIQSQGDVTFWMGKLNNITIEASCVPTPDEASSTDKTASTSNTDNSGAESKKKLTTFISPLLTNRYRQYELLLAADREVKRLEAEKEAAAAEKTAETAAAGDDSRAKAEDAKAKGEDGEKTAVASEKGDAGKQKSADKQPTESKQQIAGSVTAAPAEVATAIVDTGPHYRLPGISTTLLLPDRALAGQFITVALLDRSRAPEPNVQVSFNGNPLATDGSGQAVFQVPDETAPGRSLNVALCARPDEVPATVDVLHPLTVTTGQPPRLDRMTPLAIKDSIMTIDGHNFNGIAHNNSVIVDGSLEGKIISASPVQLKVIMPQGLRPGQHSLCVSTDGVRSNLGVFDFADTVVTVDGKDTGKEKSNVKLLVKILGTSARMNVKILNQTPDVLRLNRGAEMTITSSGGTDNTIQLFAVRAKKGSFNIDTQIEM